MRLYFSLTSEDEFSQGNQFLVNELVKEQRNKCYDEIQNIIDKYEEISAYTCCECGKPATQITTGWICPYCDDHDVQGRPIAEAYKKHDNLKFTYDESGYICDIRSLDEEK